MYLKSRNMISEKKYLLALKTVKDYEAQVLKEKTKLKEISIGSNLPEGYWYSNMTGKTLKVNPCGYSDLRDVAGFGSYEPNECWKVISGVQSNNLILKKHCL